MASPPPPGCSSRSRARRRIASRRSASRWSCWWTPRLPRIRCCCRKPTTRIPHAGGQRIEPGSPEEAALRAWIDRLAQLKGDELATALRYREEEASGGGAARPEVALRRLTHSQYNNTVRDLLGDRSLPANQFPPEDFVNGFKNQYAAQNLSPLLAGRLQHRRRETGAHARSAEQRADSAASRRRRAAPSSSRASV